MIKRTALALAAVAALGVVSGTAAARTNWDINIGLGFGLPLYSYGPAYSYYGPSYYTPPPVVYRPAPVYVTPPAYYYGPSVTYYNYGRPNHYYGGRYYRDHWRDGRRDYRWDNDHRH